MTYSCLPLVSSNLILTGVVHADLKLFLGTNLPMGGKTKAVLGVSDAKLGAALQEELNLSIQTGGVVAEIIRGEKSMIIDIGGFQSLRCKCIACCNDVP